MSEFISNNSINDTIKQVEEIMDLAAIQSIDIDKAAEQYKNNVGELTTRTQQLVKSGELSIQTFDQVKTGLQATTMSAKLTSFAMKSLMSVMSMGAMYLISELVEITIRSLDELIVTAEEAKEKADELFSKFEFSTSTWKKHGDLIKEIKEEYIELSDGVDEFGRNVGALNNLTKHNY